MEHCGSAECIRLKSKTGLCTCDCAKCDSNWHGLTLQLRRRAGKYLEQLRKEVGHSDPS